MITRLTAILLLMIGGFAPTVLAQASASIGDAGYCIAEPTAAIPGVIAAGYVQYCVLFFESGRLGDSSYIGGKISGPVAVGAATVTISYSGLVGCTLLAAPQVRNNAAALGIGQTSFQGVTITDTTCAGTVRFQVSIAAVPYVDQQFPFAFKVRDDSTAISITGTLNTVLSGTITTLVSGTLDVVNSFSEALEIGFITPLQVIGEFTNIGNTTVMNDFQKALADWMPFFAGLAFFALALVPVIAGRQPNKFVLAIAAVMLLLAAIVCPWTHLFLRIVVFGLSLCLIILFALEMDDWLEERRNKKAAETTSEE